MEATIGQILSKAIVKHRRVNKLSFAKMQSLCGVNSSTLCRIEKGEIRIDADIAARLAIYLKLPIEAVIQNAHGAPISYFPTKPMPDIVSDILAADDTLSPVNRKVLDSVFRAAYSEYAAI
jgi:transcriptional regulator with XRE-family HTH domain